MKKNHVHHPRHSSNYLTKYYCHVTVCDPNRQVKDRYSSKLNYWNISTLSSTPIQPTVIVGRTFSRFIETESTQLEPILTSDFCYLLNTVYFLVSLLTPKLVSAPEIPIKEIVWQPFMFNHSNSPFIKYSASQSIGKRVRHSVSRRIWNSGNYLVIRSFCVTVSRSVNKFVNYSLSWSDYQSVSHSICHLVIHSISLSSGHSK